MPPPSHTMSSPIRFANERGQHPNASSAPIGGVANRRASALVTSIRGKSSVGPDDMAGPVIDPFAHSTSAVSFLPSATASDLADASSPSGIRRNRGSILGGLRFPRRASTRKVEPPRAATQSHGGGSGSSGIILPGVIDIRPLTNAEEDAERERLRDAAAQSIGLSFVLSPSEAPADADDALVDDVQTPVATPSSVPVPPNGIHATFAGRRRAGSASVSKPPFRRAKTDTAGEPPTLPPAHSTLPTFPSTLSTLRPLIQLSGSAAKHAGGGALSSVLGRPWKTRHITLSSLPHACLHVFKSSNPDEREMGRLALLDNSVAYIAEEEVSGRKTFLKVTGVDMSTSGKKSEAPVAWLFHFAEPTDMHKWIATIKQTVAQRSLRSGAASQTGTMSSFVELDIPSIKAKELYPSPTRSTFSAESTSASSSGGIGRPQRAPSLRSGSTGPGAVATLRGLFAGGNRPRSPSAATLDGRSTPDNGPPPSLLGVLASVDLPSSPNMDRPFSPPPFPAPTLSPIPSAAEPASPQLDRRIVADPAAALAAAEGASESSHSGPLTPVSSPRPFRYTGALQPPPRKQRPWTMLSAPPATSSLGVDTSVGPSTALLSALSPEAVPSPEAAPSPIAENGLDLNGGPSAFGSGGFFGTPEQKPRAPSLYSVSTLASAGASISADHASAHGSDRSNTRRWSSRGLPKKTTPPTGPPPAPPIPGTSPASLMIPHPYANAGRPKSAGASPSAQRSIPSPPIPARDIRRRSNPGTGTSPLGLVATPPRGLGRFANKRASMPPPPRPAPNSALPPTPSASIVEDPISTPTVAAPASSPHPITPPAKPPLSTQSHAPMPTLMRRAFRLSLNPPQRPPPASGLPLRPDETRTHGRRASLGSAVDRSISPPAFSTLSPSPRERPQVNTLTSSPTLAGVAVARGQSLRQRLRHLSSPMPTSSSAVESERVSAVVSPSDSRAPSPAPSSLHPYAVPCSPTLGERIIPRPADLDAIARGAESRPSTPADDTPGMRSLPPPPPRRGSRQLTQAERDRLAAIAGTPGSSSLAGTQPSTPSEETPGRLTRQLSSFSIGIVTATA